MQSAQTTVTERRDGAYAAYRGRMEIMRYLLERFPNLSGFECDPSLQFARTNPGPQSLSAGRIHQ